jgi:hypothetical protein
VVARPGVRAAAPAPAARPPVRQEPRLAHHKVRFRAARVQHLHRRPVSRSAFHRTLALRERVQATPASRAGRARRQRPPRVNRLRPLADQAPQPDRHSVPAAVRPQRQVLRQPRAQARLLAVPRALLRTRMCQEAGRQAGDVRANVYAGAER